SGVTQLPPAKSADLWFAASGGETTLPTNVAIGGDIYAYDGNLKSRVKVPPHFNNNWLLMRWHANSLHAVSVDEATVTVSGAPQRIDNTEPHSLAAPANLRRPIQASYGPDGALYVLNYGGDYNTANNPGVFRVTYTGS